MRITRADLRTLALALAAIAGLTLLYAAILHVANATTVAVSFLLVVLLTAAHARLWVAAVASILAMLALNFFFLAPVGTFTIADPQDWVALFAFLAVSLVASQLSAAVRARATRALERAELVEQRKATEVARQGEALTSALLASLAHDLKTPLTSIRVAAGNLQSEWLAADQRREQSDIVVSEVERLNRLFESILDMARIDAGAVTTARRWVHPLEIVEAARAQVEHFLRDRPVDVHDETTALAELDPRLTSAALSHLLENAALYSPPGLPIAVTVRTTTDGLLISVRDRGPGIPADERPQIFHRFFRGRVARHTPGTGMGLAIAHGLLALEHGGIWMDTPPDGGTEFWLAVPAATRPVEVEASVQA